MKIAFLTAGGIAPCLSAVVGRLTENYLTNYPNAEIIGYLNGYKGLLLGNSISFPKSILGNTDKFYQFGGSPIGNSRVKLTNTDDCIKKGYIKDGENPLTVAANQLIKDGVTILHTIGGDDTNTSAADLSNYLKENNYNLTVVGLPKTVDNDVYPITQTLGAWTAAEQGAIFFENVAKKIISTNKIDFLNIIKGHIDTDAALSKVIPLQGMASAPHLDFAGEIKQETKFPIFHAAKINDVATARHAIANGKLDMVGMTRAHIADPHIIKKIIEMY